MNPSTIEEKDTLLMMLAAATLAANTTSPTFDMMFGATANQNVPFNPAAGGAAIQFAIPITSYNFGSANETYSFVINQSADGVTWVPASRVATVAGDGVPPTGGRIMLGFFLSQRYLQFVTTVGGTAPSIVLRDCYLEPFINKFAG
jgi:hypothetical protein